MVAPAFAVNPSGRWMGNDGNWSTFLVNVGTPQQEFQTLVSTGSYYSRIVTPSGCTSTSGILDWCPSSRGANGNNGYDDTQSTSKDLSATGQYNLSITDSTYFDTAGVFGRSPDGSSYTSSARFSADLISLTSGISGLNNLQVESAPLAGVVQPSYFLGSLGLAWGSVKIGSVAVPSMLDILFNTSSIPSISFAYTAGAYYRNYVGSLVIGGYDQNRIRTDQMTNDFPIRNTNGKSLFPQVMVTSVALTFGNKTSRSLTSSSSPFLALIESTTPFLYLPKALCSSFEEAFGLQYDNVTDLYRVTDAQRLKNFDTTIAIEVGDYENKGKKQMTIQFPYAAFDLNTTRFIRPSQFDNSTSYFPIRRSPQEDSGRATYVLGRTFLQEAHLIVDYERGNFTIGQAAFPSGNSVVIQNIESPGATSEKSKRLGGGVIAGIVVGILALILLLAAVVFWLVRRRKQKRKAEAGKMEADSRRDTMDTNFTGFTGTTADGRPVLHERNTSDVQSDITPGLVHELPLHHQVPHELENKTDTTNWIRNSERMSNQGQGRFFELVGDFPPGTIHSTGSTPRPTAASPALSSATPPVGSTPEVAAATLRSTRRRQSSGAVSPQSPSAGPTPRDSTQIPITPISPRASSPIGPVSPERSPDPEAERRLE